MKEDFANIPINVIAVEMEIGIKRSANCSMKEMKKCVRYVVGSCHLYQRHMSIAKVVVILHGYQICQQQAFQQSSVKYPGIVLDAMIDSGLNGRNVGVSTAVVIRMLKWKTIKND